MFLKDKEENILLPETIALPRQDSNPLVIHLEGNASDLSTRYKVKSSRGNEYEIVSFGGPSFRIYGNVDQITHVKCYNFGDWVGTTALVHDIKAHGVKNNKNVYGRPFYKTVENSYSIGAEEIYNSGSNTYVEAIACDDGESTVRAFSDYYIFPYTINFKNEDWVAYLGNVNYRSTYTSIPFAIEAMPDSKNYIDMLYFGNGGNNPGQPHYWNMTLEIYEKNDNYRTLLNVSPFEQMRLLNNVYPRTNATYNTSNQTIAVNTGTSTDWYTPSIHDKNIGYNEFENAKLYGIEVRPDTDYRFSCDYSFNQPCNFEILPFWFDSDGKLVKIGNVVRDIYAGAGHLSGESSSHRNAKYLCIRITIRTANTTGTVSNLRIEELPQNSLITKTSGNATIEYWSE